MTTKLKTLKQNPPAKYSQTARASQFAFYNQ